LKFSELVHKPVLVQNEKIGEVKDITIDTEEWKVTHLEVELTKEASQEFLGVTPGLATSARNTLAISAIKQGELCCSEKGIELKVSKGQLPIYLRPA
jgi:sporulation protein YlmC with PRC-barrel domain